MKRVLVFGMTENPGGVESFLLNYYRNIDRSKIQFDFLCNTLQPIAYEEELKQLGAKIFHITPRRKNRFRFSRELKDLFRENERKWDSIWVNVSSLANIDYLIYAKKAGIRQRIIHSHNSGNMEGITRRILHEINKRRIQQYATDYWACSESASNWFYKEPLKKKAVIIPNAIDIGKMKFDPTKREILRKQYGWGNCFVVGNVGRLHFQKNQSFLLEVFQDYHKKNIHSILVLVGQGEDRDMLENKASELGLEVGRNVFFVGVQKDIQAWLSCFDLFVFPSLFEGLSITLLEAQANGVPVLASQEIYQKDIVINENVLFLSLSLGAFQWSDRMARIGSRIHRESADTISEYFIEHGFEITHETKKVEMYLLNGR